MTDEQFNTLYSLLDTMNNNICILNDNLNNLINTTNENIYDVGREVQDITSTLIRIEDRVRSFPY